ncbi:hypothetical protein LCGC14_0401190 [marine sediment metagenome]|uniref:Uncharacterized protein n=1 Tax=marine sediment metagenome TaxID=412755 RepID=A0A0F9VIT2_9ZZZZ
MKQLIERIRRSLAWFGDEELAQRFEVTIQRMDRAVFEIVRSGKQLVNAIEQMDRAMARFNLGEDNRSQKG